MVDIYGFTHSLLKHPNGWFAVALSEEIKPAAVHSVSCLGRDLVVFRTEDGKISVQDAYCPHLGAHLGHGGHVKGSRLYCPFHQWGYDVDGRCVDIPYTDKIPPSAVNQAWPVVERNGAILVWFHSELKEPDWEVPEFSQNGWSAPRWVELTYQVHIQDIAENGVDLAHFPVLHHCARAGIELLQVEAIPFRYILKTAYPGDGIGVPGTDVNVTTRWAYYGLGMFEGVSLADDFGVEIRQLFHFTPIPNDKVLFRTAISVNTGTISADAVDTVLDKNAEIMKQNLDEDAPIWASKQYWKRPALCSGDGPFGILRRWTKRFYPSTVEMRSDPGGSHQHALPEDSDPYETQFSLHNQVLLGQTESSSNEAGDTSPKEVSANAIKAIFFEKIPAHFNARAAGSQCFIVQYQITGQSGGWYFIEVSGKQCRPFEGQADNPTVTVTIDSHDWVALQAGILNPTQAFLSGKLKVSGNRSLAMKLGKILPINKT